MAGHEQRRKPDNDLEEMDFTSLTSAPPPNAFSLGPPSSQNSTDDSGMMDDNDLTTSFLPPAGGDRTEGLTTSQIVAAAARPHSSLRLVLRKIGNWLAAFTLTLMSIVIPVVTYKALSKRKLDIAAFDSAGVMVLGTVILSVRLVYQHFTHWYMPNVQKYVVRILWMVPLYAIQSPVESPVSRCPNLH